jgi:hypothetical protein
MVRAKSPKLYQAIQPSYRNLIIIFSVLALLLVLLVLYFALSQATITITPAYAQQKVGFIVQVIDKNKTDIDSISQGKIPGLLKEVTIDTTKEFTASQIELSGDKATGKLTIINNYTENQPLVATTRFQAPNGLIFRLPESIVVPAKSKMEVTVVADKAGAEYELGPTKFIIPGFTWRRQFIWAESTGSMARTKTKEYKLTKEDIEKALAQLNVELMIKAKDQIKSQLASGESLFEKSLAVKIVKSSTKEKIGSQKEKFSASLTLNVKGLVINEQDLKQQASSNLPDAYKQKETLVKIDPESFNYEILPLEPNTENILAQIKGDYMLQAANVNIDKSKLKGLSRKDAENYLNSLSDVKEAKLSLPFWSKFLPPLEDNINIVINK